MDSTDFSEVNAIKALTSSSYHRFSSGQIIELTNNFDSTTIYNSDQYSVDYKGNMSGFDVDGNSISNLVHVKRFTVESISYFCKEAMMVIEIGVHNILIDLIGYCIDSDENILVYKYMENGRLSDYLGQNKSHKIWSWKKRVKICLEVAYGLQYLHTPTTSIAHGYIDTSNIMFDHKWVPKLSNFRYFKDVILITNHDEFKPSDVYCFGSVLIKILCWKKEKFQQNYTASYRANDYVRLALNQIDFESEDNVSSHSVRVFGGAIRKCLEPNKSKRATIDAVVLYLEAALNFQDLLVRPSVSKPVDLLNSSPSSTMDFFTGFRDFMADAILALKSSSYCQYSFYEITVAIEDFQSRLQFVCSNAEVQQYEANIYYFGPDKELISVLANICYFGADNELISVIAYLKRFYKSDLFGREVRTVMKIKVHANLLCPIGYCIDLSDNRILVYKYMQNGCLERYLNEADKIWCWKKRVKMCLDVAYAIQHLHAPTTEFPYGIPHGDVSPANILFDENWNAKLTNFIYAPIDIISSTIDDYVHNPRDVYHFGTFLIKVLCWNNVSSPREFHGKYEETDFGSLAKTKIVLESKDDISPNSLKAFSNAIKKCLHPDGYERPAIDAVVLDLEAALDFQKDFVPLQPIPTTTVDLVSSSSRESMITEVTETASTESISKATNKSEKISSSSSFGESMITGVTESKTLDNFSETANKSENIMFSSSSSFQYASPSSSSLSLFSSCQRFPLDEIKRATNNFDMKKCLGKGGEGTVYHAEIFLGGKSKKSIVAVKNLHKSLPEEFEKEIATVAKLRHPNIVSILGYCHESDHNVLIYEYMGKGSLSKYVKKNSKFCLSWKQRLNICLCAAKGLVHLHRKTKEFPNGIIHRDVKPENILIDDNWVAKLSDFGLLKFSNIDQTNSTMVTVNLRGTPGYFAPETLKGKISKKSDVYAFGFLMFEVLCRKKRWDTSEGESIYPKDDDDIGLLVEENVDTQIKDQISNGSRRFFIDVIVECMQLNPIKRPTMDKVVQKLELALKN